MALVLNPEQQMLRDNAHEFVQKRAPVKHLRELRDTKDETGFSRDLWKEMAELGWAGIVLPEEYGGMGMGYTDLGVVMEELGKNLVPQPIVSTVLLGAGCILQGGSDEQKKAILPGVAEGNTLLALAYQERPRFHAYPETTKAERSGKGFKLTGEKTFVLDGHVADTLIVTARTSGEGRDGVTLFLVDPKAKGVTVKRTTMVDSRNAAVVKLDGVEVGEDKVVGKVDQGADVLDPVLDRATICLAAEMLGVFGQAYDTTLEYLKTRVQFDVLIGSFQALQHRAVDMFCEVELARSMVMEALTAIDEGRDDVAVMASAVKARCTDASRLITREAVQMHGGIGMTDEHDIGLYLKRGGATELTFGDSAYHRDRFATLKGF